MHYIQCQEEGCGHWDLTAAKNTKRCYVCRLVRNLNFVKVRRAKCFSCQEPFCPIARDDQLCGRCAFKSTGAQEIECVYCLQIRTSIAKDISVCMCCARDPKYRNQFLGAARRRQLSRFEQGPGPQPELPVTLVDLGPDV